jgi:hypothetical protein
LVAPDRVLGLPAFAVELAPAAIPELASGSRIRCRGCMRMILRAGGGGTRTRTQRVKYSQPRRRHAGKSITPTMLYLRARARLQIYFAALSRKEFMRLSTRRSAPDKPQGIVSDRLLPVFTVIACLPNAFVCFTTLEKPLLAISGMQRTVYTTAPAQPKLDP